MNIKDCTMQDNKILKPNVDKNYQTPADVLERELEHRFTYHPPKPGQPEAYGKIRLIALSMALVMAELCPDSDERDTAFYKLEEAVMWANAAIARNG